MKAIGEFFKSALGITILIIASLGILAVVGYNFWGWFGGSASWKESNAPDFGNMTKQQLIDWLVANAGLDSSQLQNKTQEELVGIANSAYGNTGGIQPREGATCIIAGEDGTYQKMGDGALICRPNADMKRTTNNNDSVANILRMAMQEANSLRVSNDQAKIDFINNKLRENNITDIVALSKGGNQPTGKFKSCNCGGYWYSWIWRSCDDFCATSPT